MLITRIAILQVEFNIQLRAYLKRRERQWSITALNNSYYDGIVETYINEIEIRASEYN